jgi:hypothetical protein
MSIPLSAFAAGETVTILVLRSFAKQLERRAAKLS